MDLSGWLAQGPARLRAVRGGLHPASAAKIALGRNDDVRLRGVRLRGMDMRSVARTAVEVAGGEYAAPGFAIAPGERVVDGGANVGAFSVLAAHAGAHVTAYEPHPVTFADLERNVAGLGIACVRAAFAPTAGSVTLTAAASTASAIGEGHARAPAVMLATAIGPGCDLLKLDIEGAEEAVLRATAPAILARARRIACEVHPWAADAAALAGVLRAAGFEVHVRAKEHGLALLFAGRSPE